MAQFLNTAATYTEIENIVNRAEKKLVLISPIINLTQMMFQRLLHASENRGIHITIVCRKKELKPVEAASLRKITRLEIIDLPNLHAKCYFNEKSMVFSSLNLYETVKTHNREMGVLLTQEKDPTAFNDAVSEVEFMIRLAYKLEAEQLQARLEEKRVTVADVSFFDIQGGLKRSFPTFAKILVHK